MLGSPNADGSVTLFASVELSTAELSQETDWVERPDHYRTCITPPREPARVRIFLTVEMKRFVVVHAATYAEALAKLMDVWSPGDEGHVPIGGRLALPFERS